MRLCLVGALLACLAIAPVAARAAGPAGRLPYPGEVSRPLTPASEATHRAGHARVRTHARARARPLQNNDTRTRTRAGAHTAAARQKTTRKSKKPRKPKLHGNPARAQAAFEAMQRYYYVRGAGLYAGEPFSYLWPFSQALAATISMASIPGLKGEYLKEVDTRLIGLQDYLDTDNSGAPEGAYTSTLPAYDGETAPPTGPGGTKYYDDNDWIGIELLRAYQLTGQASALGAAEGIMAFEMAGWQSDPTLACPGGIPFSNSDEGSERNTVTDAPAAELGAELYSLTRQAPYLQFAEMAYAWVRRCLQEQNGLYADHISATGKVEPMLWSYNQGSMIGAATLLFQATGNSAFLYQARQTAAAALAYFTPERLASEIPFFPSVYFRNLLYLDSVTGDPPGQKLAQAYVNYAWQHLRGSNNLFVSASTASSELLVQAAIAQIYALLSSPPSTYF